MPGHEEHHRTAASERDAAEAGAAEAGAAGGQAAYRLPRHIEPLTYRLTFEPDLEQASFTGTAEIDLLVHRPSDQVVLNAVDLVLDAPELRLADGTTRTAQVEYDTETERATLVLSSPVPEGEATLTVGFTGVLNDKLHGFYRSTFTDPDGATRTIATTQMESIYARYAFPCWDEPDRKAVFEVTLVVPDGVPAYSNTPVAEEAALGDGRRKVRFAPTIKMSSYLVAMIVGPLEATEAVDVDGVALRVVHPPGKAGLTAYALEIGAFALRFFTDYFGIPYPGDKLDLVAIPDFAMGAMENLGCVTFRETALLVDPENASRLELERVADVVAHELAHMWFGDLVTMGWWEGIWLNEAFATFMEILCCDAFRPQWQRWVSFGIEREMALAVDGLHSTRPIEYPVGAPSEVDGMFDILTYQKGSSVLRMLEQYLGAAVFRDGVRRYLTDHLYANTVTSDLWDAIESVSGQPVRAVMDSWILQGGHPLVTLAGETLSQQPFAYQRDGDGGTSGGGGGSGTSAIAGPWEVPVALRRLGSGDGSGGEASTRLLLGAAPLDTAAVSASLPGDGPLVINAGGWGVYRTAYGSEQTALFGSRLSELEPLEKANLFSDTWAAVLADAVPAADFFTLALHLGDEPEPAIWGTVAGALGLCWRAAPPSDRPRVAAAARSLLGRRATQLGWDPQPDDSERTPQLRALLLATLGTIGADASVREEAARRFDLSPLAGSRADASGAADGADGAVPLDPDIASAVLEIVADQCRGGGAVDYQAILAAYRHPANPQEELRALTALAHFPDVELALATFELAVTEVRTQNAPFLLVPLVGNRVAGAAVWEQMKATWPTLIERFPESSHARMVGGVRSLFEDAAIADDVRAFLTAHPMPTGQRTVTQTVERLGINQAFAARESTRIAATLDRVVGTGSP